MHDVCIVLGCRLSLPADTLSLHARLRCGRTSTVSVAIIAGGLLPLQAPAVDLGSLRVGSPTLLHNKATNHTSCIPFSPSKPSCAVFPCGACCNGQEAGVRIGQQVRIRPASGTREDKAGRWWYGIFVGCAPSAAHHEAQVSVQVRWCMQF